MFIINSLYKILKMSRGVLDRTYSSIAIQSSKNTIWKTTRRNGDFVAGVLAALFLATRQVRDTFGASRRAYHLVLDKTTKLSSYDDQMDVLDSYIASTRDKPTWKDEPLGKRYGWWICNENSGRATCILYQFNSTDFVEGFMTICDEVLGVDFRDYVRGLPFSIEDGQRVEYNVDGYDLEPYQYTEKQLAAPQPFSSYMFEDSGNKHDYV
jgi:hypothetical protein